MFTINESKLKILPLRKEQDEAGHEYFVYNGSINRPDDSVIIDLPHSLVVTGFIIARCIDMAFGNLTARDITVDEGIRIKEGYLKANNISSKGPIWVHRDITCRNLTCEYCVTAGGTIDVQENLGVPSVRCELLVHRKK